MAHRERQVRATVEQGVGHEILDTHEAAELPRANQTLLLRKMENRLVRHHLETPDGLSSTELRKLRYILNFARLADFEPYVSHPHNCAAGRPFATREASGRCAAHRSMPGVDAVIAGTRR
jgi:hypothetical protein